jgi:hydroxypyruvate reductase
MLVALRAVWTGALDGVVVTQDSGGILVDGVEIVEASHPLPDERGLAAVRKIERLVSSLAPDDLVIALVSGGGSSLLPSPPPGFTLDDEIAVGRALLNSGASISAMNTVRKHFSTIKGGRLSASTRARVHTLILSDIPGDVASQVASGPTLPDASIREDALAVIARHSMVLPPKVMEHLASRQADAPHPDEIVFAGHTHAVVGSARLALKAAADEVRQNGYKAMVLADNLEGEAREAGLFHAAVTRQVRRDDEPMQSPVVLLSGGETTVTMRGRGKGGRNGEFLLAWAMAVDGLDSVYALAADTDGIDGSESNAGAFADGTTAGRLRNIGLDGRKLLADNDSFAAFSALGDLFVTGPTGTNVNDFRAIFVR